MKGTEGTDFRAKQEPKGTEGTDVRKKKKTASATVKPKGTEGSDVQKKKGQRPTTNPSPSRAGRVSRPALFKLDCVQWR